ncbi:TolC family protein [Methyloceanibacter sp.]|uniref:TolC family protein n=1 Tax=Methyloceanibacter sp. TaxID=1965321 RepID=UPI002D1FB913|nr:TolC family protein [Methyloceanibacter sp.]
MILTLSLTACYRQPAAYLEGPASVLDSGVRFPVSDSEVAAAAETDTAPYTDVTPNPGAAPYADGLTLREAVRRTLRFNPALEAAAIEVDAKRAESVQAGLRPNPVIEGDVQNVGQNVQESTLELSQVILLGGKRLKRIRAAELDVGVAGWDYEAVRLRVAINTAEVFVDVLASQSRIKILGELLSVAKQLKNAVSDRVDAGTVSPVELKRTDIEVIRAQALLDQERARVAILKRRLANNWGARSADFGYVQGDLATTNHLPSPNRLSAFLSSNPDVARWTTEMMRREAVLNLAKANRVPDLTVGAGARNLKDAGETGAVVGLSIPLPLFDRNQGNIAAAQTRLFKARRESMAARIDVNSQFLEAYGDLVVASQQLEALEKQVLPTAREVYADTNKGYLGGKFDLLSVLDAQQTLFSTRLEIVNARAEFHKAKVKIEALIGRGLYDF